MRNKASLGDKQRFEMEKNRQHLSEVPEAARLGNHTSFVTPAVHNGMFAKRTDKKIQYSLDKSLLYVLVVQ